MMQFLRDVSLPVAVVVLSLSAIARAEPMPQMPERGAPVAVAVPFPVVPNASLRGGVSPDRIAKALRGVQNAKPPLMRGQIEQALFNTHARSVVLIVTNEQLGSGAVINPDGTILTSAHVVAGYKNVGVIFKPMQHGVAPRESDAVKAAVVRVDEVADLALIKLAGLPADVRPLRLGAFEKVHVGLGVQAIGHPFGEAWSYTSGIVSQVRPNYEWRTVDGLMHRADVVQTQTPSNPGNAGGPVLNYAGDIVGISTFGNQQGWGTNFAVAPSEVRRLFAMTSDRLGPKRHPATNTANACEVPVRLGTERSRANDATVFRLDANCNGREDYFLVVPDNRSRPIMLFIDANENRRSEVVYFDMNHDFKFDFARYDTNEDGRQDLIGYDLNDALEPGRVELAKS